MSSKNRARKHKRINYKSTSPINNDVIWERNASNNKQQLNDINDNTHFLNLMASSQKLIDRINKEQALLKIQPVISHDNHILPLHQPLIPINYISLFFIKSQSYIDLDIDLFTNPFINQYNNQPLQLLLIKEMVNTIIPYEKYSHTVHTLYPPHQSIKNNYIPNHNDSSDTKYININKKYICEAECAEYDIILEESCSPKCKYKTEPLICAKNHRINDEYYPNNSIIKKGQLIPSHMCKYERPWKIFQGHPLRCNNIKCWFSHISGRIDHINYLKKLNIS